MRPACAVFDNARGVAILDGSSLLSRRLTRATGLLFVFVVLASEVLKGDSPSPSGPTSDIVSYFTEHRTGILAGAYVQMLGLFLLALLLVAVADALMPMQALAGRLARLGLVLTLVAYSLYVFLTAALAFGAAAAEPQTAKALWGIRFVSETFVNFPIALLIGGVALAARRTTVSRWYPSFSLLVAAAFLVGGGALSRRGFFAPDGGYGFILFWLFPLWVAVTAFAATSARPSTGGGTL